MPLSYDFDMFSVFSAEVLNNPTVAKGLKDLGMSEMMAANKIPLFRSQATVDALRRAPAPVQEFMKELGFGLNVYDSGAGPNRYLPQDEPFRDKIMAQATALMNLPKYRDAMKPTGSANDFQLMLFLSSLGAAESLDRAPSTAPRDFAELRNNAPAPRQSGQPTQPSHRPNLPPAHPARQRAKMMLLAGVLLIGGSILYWYWSNS